MQRSSDRVLTSHAGSLPRPEDLLAMVRARSIATKFHTANEDEWVSLLTRLRHQVRVTQVVDLRIGGSFSPMTWGWLHPVILLPVGANTWTDERRSAVIVHGHNTCN